MLPIRFTGRIIYILRRDETNMLPCFPRSCQSLQPVPPGNIHFHGLKVEMSRWQRARRNAQLRPCTCDWQMRKQTREQPGQNRFHMWLDLRTDDGHDSQLVPGQSHHAHLDRVRDVFKSMVINDARRIMLMKTLSSQVRRTLEGSLSLLHTYCGGLRGSRHMQKTRHNANFLNQVSRIPDMRNGQCHDHEVCNQVQRPCDNIRPSTIAAKKIYSL
ncbi:hypothetical protein VTN77DRAFT_409 [Rasamsonia byssochlamydoides]|uniref:uncharacterized protein n=1 Tax=Rasamsonia byssochlamydoides TaxID=89139 RepID=UPI00374299B8